MRDRTLTMTTTRRVLAALLLLWGAPATAQQATSAVAPKDAPRLELFNLNQTYLEGVRARTELPLADTRAMFSVVLAQLPDRVKVYPTENYFYYSFFANGVRYAGNIRLDASTRDKGKVHFAYYPDLQEWAGGEDLNYLVLDASHGVSVEKLDDLVYRVGDGRKSVIFELNDLRGVKPPPSWVLENERYIGPIFDESGIRFFLIYNSARKLFHYILDETVAVDDLLEKAMTTDRILIGRRTGFAFYRDHRVDRKILIGVHEANARVNNYFDGPFDQLPDNFIEGESLRDALLEVDPSLRGHIDRHGAAPDGSSRYMIAPYRNYRSEEDLLSFHHCAVWPGLLEETYPSCFSWVETPPEAESPPPVAPRRKARRR
jgi:hypothetical protein